jgi:hypothetical protein
MYHTLRFSADAQMLRSWLSGPEKVSRLPSALQEKIRRERKRLRGGEGDCCAGESLPGCISYSVVFS